MARAVSEKEGFFTFLRAQCSSQVASLADFFVTILLAKLFHIYYVYATFTGAVCGGIVNCIVNYKWTFKAKELKKRHVAVKYMMVWLGSIFLNTYGTYLLTEGLSGIAWLERFLGRFFADLFIVSKVIVSLVIGFFWNYIMQRYFVYKDRNIRRFFRNIVIK